MKIAILSMQRVVNYGSVLQAWSLRDTVQRITGHRAVFLDITDEPALAVAQDTAQQQDYQTPAAYPPGLLQKGKRKVISRLSAWNKRKIRRFMKRELELDRVARDGEYDCVIVGSDEVFNHARGVRLQLHGQIPQAKKAFTYAAACGSADWRAICDQPAVVEALSRFSAVSVRDQATWEYVSALGVRAPVQHLDPVLVGSLSQQKRKKVWLKKYLLVYAYGQRIRSSEEIQAIRDFARAKGLKTVAMGGSQFWCDLYIPASPMRLLDYFGSADYVVTDTFHGAVFSVISRKAFAVLPRYSNRNKITGLLESLGLQDRLVPQIGQLGQLLSQPIDYHRVEQLLLREKQRSESYLQEQLGVK